MSLLLQRKNSDMNCVQVLLPALFPSSLPPLSSSLHLPALFPSSVHSFFVI